MRMPDAVGWATIIGAIIAAIGAIIAVLALIHQIWSIRRKHAAEALERAERVSFSIERGPGFQELPSWTVTAKNRGSQPVSDVQVVLGIRAPATGPIDSWPWRDPVRLRWPTLLPEREESQDVFWEGPIDDIDGATLFGAAYRDDRGQDWARVGGGWRRVTKRDAIHFEPPAPGTIGSSS